MPKVSDLVSLHLESFLCDYNLSKLQQDMPWSSSASTTVFKNLPSNTGIWVFSRWRRNSHFAHSRRDPASEQYHTMRLLAAVFRFCNTSAVCNSPSSLAAAPTEHPDFSLAALVPLKPSWEFPSESPSFYSTPRHHRGVWRFGSITHLRGTWL